MKREPQDTATTTTFTLDPEAGPSGRECGGQARAQRLLGDDKTYVSALEPGKRGLTGLGSRRHVCDQLRLSPHILGVTGAADADHRAMLHPARRACTGLTPR
ncbi:hypothetical protein ACFZDJ_41360 [Streptomyces sp. NPDC007896]|uniref:hypothetical protein n=1 Tax=unclassified Streptomyces TaxID=2593676 RepID=UPI0036EAD9B2